MKNLDPKSKWLFFFGYFFLTFLISVFVFAWILGMLGSFDLVSPLALLFSPVLSFLFSLVFAEIFSGLTYKNWHYELTGEAIKIERGVIWKHYVSIPYERVQNVDIARGPLARILGLSDLQIQTAGYS